MEVAMDAARPLEQIAGNRGIALPGAVHEPVGQFLHIGENGVAVDVAHYRLAVKLLCHDCTHVKKDRLIPFSDADGFLAREKSEIERTPERQAPASADYCSGVVVSRI
jgi:hypothetical protein